ncbi:MAG: methylenetetrahydrofolate reductase, partial [Desulfobacula sp.]|nr:methylenetetrahydrofolate reductase [Desulfobacula sp.]
ARYMNQRVAGMDIPDKVIRRMEQVPKEQAPEEGVQICLETIEELKNLQGVHGVHIMAIEWEEIVGQIVQRSGLKKARG